MVDQGGRAELAGGPVRKAEGQRHTGYVRGACGIGIADRIADKCRAPAACAADRFADRGWVRLALRQGITADDCREATLPAERVDQRERQPFELVGADCELHALRVQRGKRGLYSLERLSVIGDMAFIITDKQRES